MVGANDGLTVGPVEGPEVGGAVGLAVGAVVVSRVGQSPQLTLHRSWKCSLVASSWQYLSKKGPSMGFL